MNEWLMAVNAGNLELMKQMLLENRDLINATTDFGETALHEAAQYGHTDVVAHLLAIAPHLSLKANEAGWTPFHDAANAGHTGVVAQLLEAGWSRTIDAVTYSRETALHFAAHQGHEQVVAQLLAAGARTDATNALSDTALHAAAYRGHTEVVRQLLAANPSLMDATNESGCTAMQYAAYYGRERTADTLLEAKPAHAFLMDKQWNTLLHLACRSCGREFVEKVWRLHPDALSKINLLGRTPFQVAIEKGNDPAIDFLQWKVETFDEITQSFRPPMMFELRYLPVMKQLCECLFVEHLNQDLTNIVFDYLGLFGDECAIIHH